MIHDRRTGRDTGRHIASSVVMFAGSGLDTGELEIHRPNWPAEAWYEEREMEMESAS